MDLNTIPEEDRSDFLQRLSRLGIDAASIEDEVLEVDSGRNLRLEMSGESPVNPLIFETSNLDTLRQWIGTPDRAVAKRTNQPFEVILKNNIFGLSGSDNQGFRSVTNQPKKRRSKKTKASTSVGATLLKNITKIDPDALLGTVNRVKIDPTANRLASNELDTIRAAARTYIHGDCKAVEDYKPAIEAFFGTFQIAVWLKAKIIIKKNSTLTLGAGVHNLTAHEMIIESGGKIRSHGHLTVSVTKIRRPAVINPGLVFPNHILSANTLPRDPFFP